jgi:hypothetical protein
VPVVSVALLGVVGVGIPKLGLRCEELEPRWLGLRHGLASDMSMGDGVTEKSGFVLIRAKYSAGSSPHSISVTCSRSDFCCDNERTGWRG